MNKMTTQENTTTKKPSYFDALKIWNEGHEGKRLVPKKGTSEYDEVCIIFKDLKLSAGITQHTTSPKEEIVEILDVSVAPVNKVRAKKVKKEPMITEPVMEPITEPIVEKVKKPRKPRAKKVNANERSSRRVEGACTEVEEEPSL